MDSLPNILPSVVCLVLAYVAYVLLIRTDNEKPVEYSCEVPEQCMPGWQGKVLSNPSIKSDGSANIQCYAPASGRLLGSITPTTPDDIDRVIATASSAQQEWKQTTFTQRRKVLRTLMKFVMDNQEDIVRASCLDSGKTRVDALFGELLVTASKLQWTIKNGERALSPDRRGSNFLMFYKKNEIIYEPMGVVAACVSWNYPFHNLIGPVISALFAGDAIVVKVSEQTAWSTSYFIKIIRGALSACGFSPDVVHAIATWPEAANHFTSHPGIAHLTFIGSRPVAHEVAKSASKSLTPLCLELGGKDAAIVLDDARGHMSKSELGRIESIIMRGVFQSAGQNCVGIERVVAMPKAYDALVQKLTPRIQSLRLGDDLDPKSAEYGGVDVGAMISAAHFTRLEAIISEAESQGARVIAGGRRFAHPRYASGHYFSPTLIVDVTPDMRIAQEELFAPVCVLMRAATVEDAIRISNAPNFGLGCSLFGPDSSSEARRNLELVKNNVRVGMVAVNDFAAYYVVQLPFGGVGGSGYGRFAADEGLRSLCNAKSVCSDRFPLIKTAIPSSLDYPMHADARFAAEDVVGLGYGDMPRKLRAIRRLAGL